MPRWILVSLVFLAPQLAWSEPIAAFSPPKGWELKEKTSVEGAELQRYLPKSVSFGVHSEIIEQRSTTRDLEGQLRRIRQQFQQSQCTVEEEKLPTAFRFTYACPTKRIAGIKEIYSSSDGRLYDFTYEKDVREWPLSKAALGHMRAHISGRVKICQGEDAKICAQAWSSKFKKLEALKK